jgi:hypothetical protein
MSGHHGSAGRHASAIVHHTEAAQKYREAARHYLIGKDYDHAAHMALIAHGHALQAIKHGDDAGEAYVGDGGSVWPRHPKRIDHRSGEPNVAIGPTWTILSAAEHHTAAADRHDRAAAHHSAATGYAKANDVPAAIEKTRSALEHAHQALFHGDEAAKHHAEHYGRAHPTAELV